MCCSVLRHSEHPVAVHLALCITQDSSKLRFLCVFIHPMPFTKKTQCRWCPISVCDSTVSREGAVSIVVSLEGVAGSALQGKAIAKADRDSPVLANPVLLSYGPVPSSLR